VAAIERILQADILVMQNEQEVFTAMTALQEGRGSFADALIGALGDKGGRSRTVTFDSKALQLSTSAEDCVSSVSNVDAASRNDLTGITPLDVVRTMLTALTQMRPLCIR
jgi:hypothetical protein